jgi:hypothetical protein
LCKALPLYSKRRGPEAKALVEFQVRVRVVRSHMCMAWSSSAVPAPHIYTYTPGRITNNHTHTHIYMNTQAGFDYDAKTKEGFLRFILPLILDSIFHRLAPRVFAPNGIRLLQVGGYISMCVHAHIYIYVCLGVQLIRTQTQSKQDHRYSYTAVRNRKRRDRALQALLIGSVVTGVGRLALWAAKAAAQVVLKA